VAVSAYDSVATNVIGPGKRGIVRVEYGGESNLTYSWLNRVE
jgi:hypothetical protein